MHYPKILFTLALVVQASAQHPCIENHVHDQGRIELNMVSGSMLGSQAWLDSHTWDLPCEPGRAAPSLEYPAGSDRQYLYDGHLWFGALLEEVDGDLTPRVSFGSEGWNRDVTEFFGSSDCDASFRQRSRITQARTCDGRDVYDPAAVADQEFISSYTDTLTDLGLMPPGSVFDPDDGDHRPLGIEVNQTSSQWNVDPDWSSVILLHYVVRNIGNRTLHSPYAGLYLESDIMPTGEPNGWADDLALPRPWVQSGSQDSLRVDAVVFLDNDGRASGDYTGNNFTCPDAFAMLPLFPDGLQTSFNWWKSNGDISRDYGPSWSWWSGQPGYGMEWCDTLGTPRADRHKYQLMSNGEWDPAWYASQDGPYPSQDLMDANGQVVDTRAWTTPTTNIHPAGDDVRGLLSVGPLGTPDGFDELGRPATVLAPGEEVSFDYALVMGDAIHQACCPQPDIQNHVDPALFDFTNLDHRLSLVKTAFAQGLPPLPMPPAIATGMMAPGTVGITWTTPDTVPQQYFRLEREHVQSGVITVLADSTVMQSWTDSYEETDSLIYRVRTVWPDGLSAQAELLVTPGYPLEVASITATAGDHRIDLTFETSAPGIMIVYGVMPENNTRSEYCWAPECEFITDTLMLVNTGSASLDGLQNLARYFFKVHAVSGNQLASSAAWHSGIPHMANPEWRVFNMAVGSIPFDSEAEENFALLFESAGLAMEYETLEGNQRLSREQWDGSSRIWLNMDQAAQAVTTKTRALDLAHFQESGGTLVVSTYNLLKISVTVPLDPNNPADVETRHYPGNYHEPEVPFTHLFDPWEVDIVDPVLGVLSARSLELGSPFLGRPLVAEDGWAHAGLYSDTGSPNLDGYAASLTATGDRFTHLMRMNMSYVDVEASLTYLVSLLENGTSKISDLRIHRFGPFLELDWTPVSGTQDYVIRRYTNPYDSPETGTVIGTTLTPPFIMPLTAVHDGFFRVSARWQ